MALLLQCLGLPRSSLLAGLAAIGLATLCGLLQPLGLLALAVAGGLSYVVYRFPVLNGGCCGWHYCWPGLACAARF
jgi:hypothetical protein